MKLSKTVVMIMIIFAFILPAFRLQGADAVVPDYPKKSSTGLSKAKITRIESFIKHQTRLGKIPGMAVAVVKDDQVVYKRGFGYGNIREKQPVTPQTLFELGSTSKAFTALGVLYLAEKGLLNINDPVKKYLPWFKMTQRTKITDPTMEYLNRYLPWFYATRETNITIEQLLHHTSGIDPGSIADIPSSEKPDSLEKSVRILMKKAMTPQLDYYPGDRYSYAIINYDILGLIIAKVSGRSYEDFIKDNILNPLGLNHTVLFRNQAGENLATGYKVGFLRPLAYQAPVYRGNTPAGYIITSADDMTEWLKVQLGTVPIAPFYQKIVNRSHSDDYDYGYGWFTYRISNNLKIFHGGNNPNYSSYVEFRPQEKLGIVLLLNSNSGFVQGIGEGIINIINDRGRIPERLYDQYVDLDGRSCLLILGVGIIIWLTIRFTVNRFQLKRRYIGVTGRNFTRILILGVLMIGFCIFFFFIPEIVFGYNWSFIAVWGPVTLLIALAFIFMEVLLVFWYLFDVLLFEVKHKPRARRI
jgi:CubicO group peptidase (beta-lactamase class C family)